jgi:D-3-phosphoglycerate dehydrogenase
MVSAPYMQPDMERFRPIFQDNDIELIVPPVHERLEEEELLEYARDVDGVICGDDRFTQRVLDELPQLKVISKWGTGIDSIDQKACLRLGIRVCNTPNAFSKPVADSVLGFMLSFARTIPWTDTEMKKGRWEKTPGRSLSECKLGVIGVGNVGSAVAKRAAAFGMQILGSDPVQPSQPLLSSTGIEMTFLPRLLEEADFVSVNCDLNSTSHHLLSDSQFELMKPTAVVINTARGPIVDEHALVRALEGNKIAGAGLDVFEHEPLPQDSPLRKMDNVLLAPHNSNSSPEAWEKVHENTINNLLDVLHRRARAAA